MKKSTLTHKAARNKSKHFLFFFFSLFETRSLLYAFVAKYLKVASASHGTTDDYLLLFFYSVSLEQLAIMLWIGNAQPFFVKPIKVIKHTIICTFVFTNKIIKYAFSFHSENHYNINKALEQFHSKLYSCLTSN